MNRGVCRAVVEKSKKENGPSGFAAWQALKTWRNSDEQKTVLIKREEVHGTTGGNWETGEKLDAENPRLYPVQVGT